MPEGEIVCGGELRPRFSGNELDRVNVCVYTRIMFVMARVVVVVLGALVLLVGNVFVLSACARVVSNVTAASIRASVILVVPGVVFRRSVAPICV